MERKWGLCKMQTKVMKNATKNMQRFWILNKNIWKILIKEYNLIRMSNGSWPRKKDQKDQMKKRTKSNSSRDRQNLTQKMNDKREMTKTKIKILFSSIQGNSLRPIFCLDFFTKFKGPRFKIRTKVKIMRAMQGPRC